MFSKCDITLFPIPFMGFTFSFCLELVICPLQVSPIRDCSRGRNNRREFRPTQCPEHLQFGEGILMRCAAHSSKFVNLFGHQRKRGPYGTVTHLRCTETGRLSGHIPECHGKFECLFEV